MSTALGATKDDIHSIDIVDFTPEIELDIAFFHLWYRTQLWSAR